MKRYIIVILTCLLINVGYAQNSVSRAQAVANFDALRTHAWYPTNTNIKNFTCGGVNVTTPGWVVANTTNYALPYCWGGTSTISQFNTAISNGVSAGDITTSGSFAGAGCSAGVDCSGGCWVSWGYSNGTRPLWGNTSGMANHSWFPSITGGYTVMQQGDISIKSGVHVRMVKTANSSGTHTYIESTGTPYTGASTYNKVVSLSISLANQQGYSPYSYIGYPQVSIPATPSLISPSNASTVSTTTSASFSWGSVTGATSYRLIVSTSPSGFSTTNGLTTGVVYNGTTSNTSLTISGLTANTTYYWTVRSGNSIGGSLYASYRYFTTAANGGGACSDPFESNNTMAAAYNFNSNTSWSNSSPCLYANDYDYYRFTYNGSIYYFYVKGYNSATTGNYGFLYNISGSTLTIYTYSVNGSTTDTWLYLLNSSGTVLANNDDYNGNFSQITYTLSGGGGGNTCNAPTGLYYSNLTNAGATCSWINPAGLSSTDFYYSWDNVNWYYLQNIASNYNGINLNLSGNSGYIFYWKVRANCTNGMTSSYSVTNSFYIPYIVTGNGGPSTVRQTTDFPTASVHFDKLSVSPNPTGSKLSLTYESLIQGEVKVSLIDITGKTVIMVVETVHEGTNQFTYDVSGYADGVYSLVVTNGTETLVEKVQVVK